MSNDALIGILFFVAVFFVAPVLVVRRLSRRPVGGDVPMKLTLRGMVACGSIGALLAALTVGLWVAAGDEEFFNRRNTTVKGLVCMLVGTGVVAGILSGPLEVEEEET